MTAFKCKTWMDKKAVVRAVKEASLDPLDKCAALTESEMKRLLNKGGGSSHKPSSPPNPPRKQTGNLANSVRWARVLFTRVVGTTITAWYGAMHEWGGTFKDKLGRVMHFPARPYARPALMNSKDKYAEQFRNMKLSKTPEGRRLNSRKGK